LDIPSREIRLSALDPCTINCFEDNKSQGLTDCQGAVMYLRDL